MSRLRRHALDAPGLYAAATVLFLGITSLAWLGTPSLPGPGLGRADIATALWTVALGLAAFGVGARLGGVPRAAARAALSDAMSPSPAALGCAFGVSLAVAGISLGLG